MKKFKFFFFFFLPLFGLCQELTGVWTGTLSNDSLTIRKNQTFEIALTENRGAVYGYTYSTFIANDSLFYIIKRVKGSVKGNICVIKDDEIVTHNFQRRPEKGINVVYTFRHNEQENIWKIDGNWKTNSTKNFYSISGEVNATPEKDLSRSKLYQHLGDLNLQNTLVLNKTKASKPEKRTKKENPDKENIAKSKSSEKKTDRDLAKQNTAKNMDGEVKTATNKKALAEISKVEKETNKEKESIGDVAKLETAKPEEKSRILKSESIKAEQTPIDKKPVTDISKTEVKKPEEKNDIIKTEQKPQEKNTTPEFVFSELKRPERKINLATAMLEERISVPSETIYFKSDSLVLALYDNGEIDGDTVSVILNGELIIEKLLLKSVAFKKTIYLAPDESDSVLLVLFAENLGVYPPNTGLLIVKDGEESYYVRFNADYDRNAAILLRRKLK